MKEQTTKKSSARRWIRILTGCMLAAAVSVCLMPGKAAASVLNDRSIADSVPKTLEETEVKWMTQVGDPDAWMYNNYNATATSPVQVGDVIFVLGNGKLTGVNASDGKIVGTADESLDSGYNYSLTAGQVNGETLLFFQYSTRDPQTLAISMHVAAYDTSFQKRWSSAAALAGTSGYCPLICSDGIVYGMTWGGSASVFAVDGTTGAYLWQRQITGGGDMSGSYCAQMTVVGDYVIGGSEGGTVYVFRKSTGDIIDMRDLFTDYRYNIRSGITYANGQIYFTTTDTANSQEARIYAIAFDSATGKLGLEKSSRITPSAIESVSTPQICNGRIYVGCTQLDDLGTREGAVAVLNQTDLSLIYEIEVPGNEPGWNGFNNKCTDPALVFDEKSQTVYGYVMYYDTPGTFVGFTDRAGQTRPDAFNAKDLMAEDCSNYCASSILVGDNGRLYLTNDSGYLICAGLKVMMTQGDGSQVTSDGKTDLTFRSNAPMSQFQYVAVDGKILDPSCYERSEGSTIITLKASYLSGLSEGRHTISIVSTGGSADGTFTVTKQQENTPAGQDNAASSDTDSEVPVVSPKTGEGEIGFLLFLPIAAGAAAVVLRTLSGRRERN